MTPADVARLVQRYGETITLQRLTAGVVTASLEVKGRVTGFEPAELVGDIQQGDRRVVISNAEIAAQGAYEGSPRIGDRAVIGGKTFTLAAVDTRRLGDDIAGHWMAVRG
jgi:hypothetical protein